MTSYGPAFFKLEPVGLFKLQKMMLSDLMPIGSNKLYRKWTNTMY
jgi:hypothetical protein